MDPLFGGSSSGLGTPYGQQGPGMPTTAAPSPVNWKYAAAGVVCCVVLVCVAYWYTSRPASSSSPMFEQPGKIGAALFGANAPSPAMVLPSQAPAAPVVLDNGQIETREPDAKLVNFAFEPLLRSGYVPSMDLTLVRKPAANPVYSLVSCGLSNTRYAIRWRQRYLTVINDDTLQWTDTKMEPHSCFVLVPSYCQVPGDSFVMLRSAQTGSFLRFDEATGKIMCQDAPTQNTAQKFCWKLRGAESIKTDAACGCQYDYNVRGVVCTPCGVTNSAAPATPAPMPGPWPELVGWDVDQAYAFLQQRHSSLTLVRVSCAQNQPCLVVGVPPGVDAYVVLRYDPLSKRVLFTPSVERAGTPKAPAPIQFRV